MGERAVSAKKDAFLPWVEKYRPAVLEDVVGNPEAITRLQAIARDGNMPHLIFSASLCRAFALCSVVCTGPTWLR